MGTPLKKILTVAAVLVATVGSMLTASVTPAHAQYESYYGAIAVSLSTGRYGYSYDYPSYAAAEASAEDRCGVADCVAKISWRNGCGALAVSSNYFSYGAAATRSGARREALANNPGNAYIEHWNCTSGYSL
ncbi:DUF4189 domain-containing protein [Nocardia donostiensis]|uniref:DUF4189 domain-containing protein n=1 Tax=Nocardia donostiensis TaxID=1538463 RepID=A0A1V2TE86_9NOCA|nr:DUF4189 domain-containing protein [Nocardia donostiensis]ONM47795.1 hypothetical protein B0T46_16280 [Nocardia donostiensis]OQS13726.1 hypothetical protein B0T36_18615 [Nocardia donostiensis]OQS22547.1 hypothetical protein B0T44_05340 [Nocardia donostiensis]